MSQEKRGSLVWLSASVALLLYVGRIINIYDKEVSMSHPAGYGNIGIGYCIQFVFATVYLIIRTLSLAGAYYRCYGLLGCILVASLHYLGR